jgi:hypothetical protein
MCRDRLLVAERVLLNLIAESPPRDIAWQWFAKIEARDNCGIEWIGGLQHSAPLPPGDYSQENAAVAAQQQAAVASYGCAPRPMKIKALASASSARSPLITGLPRCRAALQPPPTPETSQRHGAGAFPGAMMRVRGIDHARFPAKCR